MTENPPASNSWLTDCGSTSARDRRNQRRYTAGLLLWAATYLGATFAIVRELVPTGALRWLVALSPSLVALVPLVLFLRFLRETDELQRRIQVEALAMGLFFGFVAWPGESLLAQIGVDTSRWPSVVLIVIGGYMIGIATGHRRYR